MLMTDSFSCCLPRVLSPISALAALLLIAPSAGFCQAGTCSPITAHAPTASDKAYNNSDFATAEQLYTQALAQNPKNLEIEASLVRTLLHEDKIDDASQRVQGMLDADAHSAAALTAQAEVEMRQGLPWEAMHSLDRAQEADPCYARQHLIRSRALRLDSMHASERAELQKAYEIDPTDEDIQNAWHSIVSSAQEIEGTQESLDSMTGLDAATRKKAEQTVHDLMPLLSEDSQTCKVLPSTPAAILPLLPSKEDGKTIDSLRVEVQLPKTPAKLVVDSAASGLYITRALAEENGLRPRDGDPPGTVRVDSVHVGPLEFRDCLVGVSDTPFADKGDGFVGTDLFSSYLIEIDPRAEKMTLGPLPALRSTVPGDRPTLRELAAYTPVYHRRQYLLVPVTLNNKARELFVLDTGMRFSTMTPEIAHAISNMKVNFTNTLQTVSGPAAHVYRDSFDFQFANLALNHQNHVLEFDPAAVDHNAGFAVGGLLGFDVLHLLTLTLDYRDGLVAFGGANVESAPASTKDLAASPAPARSSQPVSVPAGASDLSESNCGADNVDRPLNATLEGTVQIAMDSGHLKPGKEVWVKTLNEYSFSGCTLNRDAVVYGHVIAASSKKNSDTAELAIAFDRGDCLGHGKQQISLRLIGIVAPPPGSAHLHEMLPTEVVGGARRMSDTTGETDGYDPKEILTITPAIVHPGVVIGMPHLSLEPHGGPGCTSRIVSTKRSVELNEGVELILAAYEPAGNKGPDRAQ